MQGGEPRKPAFLSGRNQDQPYLRGWTATGGAAGRRGGCWAERSSRNLPSSLSGDTEPQQGWPSRGPGLQAGGTRRLGQKEGSAPASPPPAAVPHVILARLSHKGPQTQAMTGLACPPPELQRGGCLAPASLPVTQPLKGLLGSDQLGSDRSLPGPQGAAYHVSPTPRPPSISQRSGIIVGLLKRKEP